MEHGSRGEGHGPSGSVRFRTGRAAGMETTRLVEAGRVVLNAWTVLSQASVRSFTRTNSSMMVPSARAMRTDPSLAIVSRMA